ncbi:RNA polymerase sigma factor [Nocardioidaceae bacterium SCSIO 66511]|nr:RNA polymerase sigma factor [Nocardioidaceae bacterium SCSIO 66511]
MDNIRSVEAVWRIESAALIAYLTKLLRDLGRAEEIAQDTFVLALEKWPTEGMPPNPGGWLMRTAKHKAIDHIRRERSRDEKYAQLASDPTLSNTVTAGSDDVLSLIFVACHPVLSREARVALTLRVVAGLSTDEIAHAFLVPSKTLGQRISRAKRTLAEAKVPFELPVESDLTDRVHAVLEVVYLVFNEGYAATSGDSPVRRDLAEEAMRLGRILAARLPQQPEVHGLVALMELQASRFATRARADGTPVVLADQDRTRWDHTLITHGLGSLDRAIGLRRPLGPYTVQAAIAACHARARTFGDTDWEAIVALYDALTQLAPSPVVEVNRAVAVLHADGPQAALDAIDAVADDPRLAKYHLLGAVRGDVLLRLGRSAEAAECLERAAALAPTKHERNLLMERAAAATTV